MEKIPIPVLLILSLVITVTLGYLRTFYSKRITSRLCDFYLFSTAVSFFGAIVLFALGGFRFDFSPFTLLFGVLFGLMIALQMITNSSALSLGPWSLTSVIISLSTIIPTLSGVMFWNEKLYFKDYSGIILMLVCFVLCAGKDNNGGKKASVKWFVICLISAFFNGMLGVFQKMHQMSEYKNEVSGFLITAFLVSALISFVGYLILRKKSDNGDNTVVNKKKTTVSLLVFASVGVFMALIHIINLYLAGVMDSAAFFPVINGGGLIICSILSVLIFKEKLSVKEIIGLCTGIIAVLLLCL